MLKSGRGQRAVVAAFMLAALAAVSSACSASEVVIDDVATPEPTVSATSTPVEEAGVGVGVPFPPSDNLVEWPSFGELMGPRAIQEAALEQPIAQALPDPQDLAELFGGAWQLESAERIEPPDQAFDLCDGTDAASDSTGVRANYAAAEGLSVLVILLEDDAPDQVLTQVRQAFTCVASIYAITDVAAPDVPGTQQQIALELSETDQFSDVQLSMLGVTKDQFTVVVGVDTAQLDSAAPAQDRLAQLAALILERLDS